jgi:uncharacterized protein
MRRSERGIGERGAIDEILRRATVVYLGLNDDGLPYVVPMNFGYDGQALYLHSAPEGRKLEILRRCPRVSFAVTVDDEVVPGAVGCQWSARYRSVLGEGDARFLTAREERVRALDTLLGKFALGPFAYDENVLARTAVIRVDIRHVTGKQAGWSTDAPADAAPPAGLPQ